MGAWLTHRRMARAAELLLGDPQASIAEIGGMVGYDSASKFAAAFKKAMKLSFALFPSTLIGTLPAALALAARGVITAPQAALAVMLSISMVGSLARLEVFSENMRQVKFTVEELEKFLEMPPLPEPAQCADVPHTDVVLKNVRFSYTGEEKDEVLHGIDLTLPEGSFTSLVGPSGGGKTTICSLLARFYDPQGASKPRAGGCDALPCGGRDGTALLSRLFSVRHRRAAGQQISKCP